MNTTLKRACLYIVCSLVLPGLALAQPPNDSFSAPTIVEGFPVTVAGSNQGATLEQDEPVPSSSAEASVWFAWEASLSGAVQIDTFGSDFDTWLAVWTGTELNDLTLLAENDDFAGLQSAIFLNVTAGTTYRIAVYGYSSSRGDITLSISDDLTSKISGTVTGPDGTTPLQGIEAESYRWNDSGSYWDGVQSVETDPNGNYAIGGLPAGTYRVQFRDWNGDYLSEVYDNAPDLDSGTDIVVAAETTVTGIDASLASIAPPDPPRIVALRQVGGNDWEIQYVGTVEQEYILQEVPSLTSSWADVGTSFLCQPGTNAISRQSAAPAMFWRLREIP